jgi:hypothetical protein
MDDLITLDRTELAITASGQLVELCAVVTPKLGCG